MVKEAFVLFLMFLAMGLLVSFQFNRSASASIGAPELPVAAVSN